MFIGGKCAKSQVLARSATLDKIPNKRVIENEKTITKKFVRRRIATGKIRVNTSSGPETPLAAVKPKILNTILSTSEIREPLNQSRCINLVNDIIKDTPSQTKLSSFKSNIKSSTKKTEIDKVGAKYWRGFRRRHAHLLENKKGEKFELD